MKKSISTLLLFAAAFLFAACGGDNSNTSTSQISTGETSESSEANGNPSYDPDRGEGKFKEVEMAANVDQAMVTEGKKIVDVKCSACHKLTNEKLVGPGWSGVTGRHKPAWIMNFITNTDEMLNKDPMAQAQLEICLVRMPNQSLSDNDARNLLEFMRFNDGVK